MVVACAMFVLLGFAAWRDLATRTIPDVVSLAILVLGVVVRCEDGGQAIAISAAVAVLLFVLLIPLQSFGLIGGGDLKLLAALAFGLSPLASYQMISCVIMAGGVLAAVYLALRRVAPRRVAARPGSRRRSLAHRIWAVELWRIRRGAPLPYGIAIAAGAALILHHQGA